MATVAPVSLEKYTDDELRAVIGRSNELLAERDRQRKDKALALARETLEAVGLSLKDLNGKGKKAAKAGPVYRKGITYQHPANNTLVYGGHGKKPAWLNALEAEGGKAVEIVPPSDNTALGKPANDTASRKVG
jgi:DNA-binding protein H-NS